MGTEKEEGGEPIINEDIASAALEMVLPALRRLARISWGSPGVSIVIDVPGNDEPFVHVMQELDGYNGQRYNSHSLRQSLKRRSKQHADFNALRLKPFARFLEL